MVYTPSLTHLGMPADDSYEEAQVPDTLLTNAGFPDLLQAAVGFGIGVGVGVEWSGVNGAGLGGVGVYMIHDHQAVTPT